jgi:hypothetical protein
MNAYATRLAAPHEGPDAPSVPPDACNFNTEDTEAARSSRKALNLRFATRNNLREALEYSLRELRVFSVSSVLNSSFFPPAAPA